MELRDRITLLAALARGSTEDVRRYLDSPGTVDQFRAFLAHHQLLGYCAYVFQQSAQRDRIPGALLEDAEIHARKLRSKIDKVVATLPLVSAAFTQADIQFIVLKGLHHALRFYGGLERRTFWDLDLLVHPTKLAAAHDLLIGQGYEPAAPNFFGDSVTRYLTHARDYRRSRWPDIDLHWSLANHPGLRIKYGALWESKQLLALDGTSFSALSDAYALTFLLIGIVKDLERGGLRLRSMVDLHLQLQAMDPMMDWTGFFADRSEEGIERLCIEVLGVFFELFQVKPEEFPRLHGAIEGQARLSGGRPTALELIRPGYLAVRNKRWASQLYATSPAGYVTWWAVSLPARLLVHGRSRRPSPRTRKRQRH